MMLLESRICALTEDGGRLVQNKTKQTMLIFSQKIDHVVINRLNFLMRYSRKRRMKYVMIMFREFQSVKHLPSVIWFLCSELPVCK